MRRLGTSQQVAEIVKNEIGMMKELDHRNIIKILDFSEEAKYTLPDGRSMDVYYIALELAQNGEIFDYVAETGRFSEALARHFFHNLVDGLTEMHELGISHRDIKPENILLGEDFSAKFTDFGFAQKESTSSVRKGTSSYMAPEMFLEETFETQPLDIFALAIVLFIMIKGSPPFSVARNTDQYYKLFVNRTDIFWKAHFKKFREDQPSDEVVDLLTKMLNTDPEERMTLQEIKESAWFNGPLLSQEEVVEEMNRRKQLMGADTDSVMSTE
jgi:serine/threonine protein kinase